MAVEKRRFHLTIPCLQKDYATIRQYFTRDLLKALPNLSLGRSLLGVLAIISRKTN